MDPKRQSVHQSLSHPLCDYWINSSHNTYLCGDQVLPTTTTTTAAAAAAIAFGVSAAVSGKGFLVMQRTCWGCCCCYCCYWCLLPRIPSCYHGHLKLFFVSASIDLNPISIPRFL